jgi:hypothetical protein
MRLDERAALLKDFHENDLTQKAFCESQDPDRVEDAQGPQRVGVCRCVPRIYGTGLKAVVGAFLGYACGTHLTYSGVSNLTYTWLWAPRL